MKTYLSPLLATFTALVLSPAALADDISSLFAPTSDPSSWSVSTNVTSTDTGSDSSRFLTGAADFHPAVQVSGRGDYIANNSSGTNGSIGNFTQFVFRQSFDLSGFDFTTAHLSFEWAADDIPTPGYWDRGNWVPQFRLNGGAFQGAGTANYNYTGNVVQVTSGFVSGVNTMDFYVQGNGVTDGMELKLTSFTADRATTVTPSVPDSGSTAALLLLACGTLVAAHRRFATRK